MSTALIAALALVAQSSALKLPIQQRAATPSSFSVHSASSQPTLNGYAQGKGNDVLYLATVTVGNKEFKVQLDTASSDLWVNPKAAPAAFGANDLGLPDLKLTYPDGSVLGKPATAKFVLGDETVQQLAFLSATSTNIPAITSQGGDGILGLGFSSASHLQAAAVSISQAAGQPFLHRIFSEYPLNPNFFALSLSRTEPKGTLFIGEVDGTHNKVLAAPKVPVIKNTKAGAAQQWTVALDSLTIAGAKANVTANTAGKPAALLDSGFSRIALPKRTVGAIYSNIPGSKYNKHHDLWFTNCLAHTTVSFTIGGVDYAINPLDLTTPVIATLQNGNKVTFCVNTIRSSSSQQDHEVILGDTFLRNVVSLYDFGDEAASSEANPFVRLLSQTDAQAASAAFKTAREQQLKAFPPLGVVADQADDGSHDTTNVGTGNHEQKHHVSISGKKGTQTNNKPLSHNVAAVQNVAEPSSTDVAGQVQQLLDFSPILLALLAANVVLGLGLCILGGFIIRSQRAKRARREPAKRDPKARAVATSYAPVVTGDEVPPSPLPYRDDDAASKAGSANYRDSGVSWADMDRKPMHRGTGQSMDAGDMGAGLSDSPNRTAFPAAGPLTSPSRESLSTPDANQRHRMPSQGSVYSQHANPFRTQSQTSLAPEGGSLVPPQPAFANGRRPSRDSPAPAPDSPNAQLPLAGGGLRPQRQPSTGPPPPDNRALSMYESSETTEHQLAAQQRRYSHAPPAFGAGGGPSFPPAPQFPQVPQRSPQRGPSGHAQGYHGRRPSQ